MLFSNKITGIAIVKVLRFFLPLVIASAFAQPSDLMSSRDLLKNDSSSNISLQNNRNIPVDVFGLYVRQYAYVTPGQSCNNATVIYPSSNNITAGAVVMPMMIGANRKAAIGSNYLYNMLYQTIYYENILGSAPTCALPGCTWGSDSSKYNWCIYLGAIAPVSNSSGYTANVPPSTETASSAGLYNYNLVTNYIYLGPIACDDQAQTCTTATPQTQSFS